MQFHLYVETKKQNKEQTNEKGNRLINTENRPVAISGQVGGMGNMGEGD